MLLIYLMNKQRNPYPTSDIIIEVPDGKIILIERENEPFGWAIPGGFIDTGESAVAAAIREAKEETSLNVSINELFGVYSKPERDPRFHTLTVVYIAKIVSGDAKANDDAKNLGVFNENNLPENIAFDHRDILNSYFEYKKTGKKSLSV